MVPRIAKEWTPEEIEAKRLRVLACAKRWNEAHKDKVAENGKRYREANKEKLKKYWDKYYAKKKKLIATKRKERAQTDPKYRKMRDVWVKNSQQNKSTAQHHVNKPI